jgi:energy-coupling factor transporter ATP-binding protein EcfA2
MISLRVEHLHYAYNGTPALVDISLTIAPGEFVAVVGQNGSGKTTLVKHFNGLLKPTRGRVWVADRETGPLAVADLARQVGYVFQNPDHQISQPTVRAEIAFGLHNLGFARSEVAQHTAEALATFGLEAFANQPPAVLGFGLRRKVALASVCVLRPPVLILDEPTNGLEARAADEVLQLAETLCAEGHTIVLISHDMRRVAAHARRCVLLKQGRLVRDAPTRDVFADIQGLTEARLAPPPVTQLAHALNWETPLTPEEFYAQYAQRRAQPGKGQPPA